MAVPRRVAGLYAVTPERLAEEALLARAGQALAGGARVLQFRDKSADRAQRTRLALALAALCKSHDALFIVNDDVQLALACGAHGVHLGRDDDGIAHARAMLGPRAVIGASCYDELSRAQQAAQAGADYLAFGSFFPSRVKPGAVRAPLALLQAARRRFRLPLVAIGGITPDNASQVIGAGADAIAVVSALFDAADTVSAARSLSRLFHQDATAISD
jgi:thiamine-phosphate pyrophosphorylase